MVQKLEAIGGSGSGGGGGSIKVGTKGTISSLMTRELDSIKTPKQTPLLVAASSATPTRLQLRKSLDGASTSGGRNTTSYKSPQSTTVQKTQSFPKNVHQMPMLGSENVALERTPIRHKSEEKMSNIVEVVDIKCGNTDRAWASPITNRLKKLRFSKLSESIV